MGDDIMDRFLRYSSLKVSNRFRDPVPKGSERNLIIGAMLLARVD